MIMTIGFVVVALLLVTAVVSASSVHLQRKRLLALADLAALAAADTIDTDAYFGLDQSTGRVHLDPTAVRAEVLDYLAQAAPADVDGVELVGASADDTTVTVTLHALAHPAVISWVTAPWSDGIDLVVMSSARAG